MKKRVLSWLGILLLAGLFAAVFIAVLEMRITKGDAYPHFATYRTDPLGASALFEAFGRLSGITVLRNVESLMEIDSLDDQSALFLVGIPQRQFQQIRIPDASPVLEAIEKSGTRLILTINPVSVPTDHINTLSENEEEWLKRRRKDREERRRKLEKARDEEKQQEQKPSSDPKVIPEKKKITKPGAKEDEDWEIKEEKEKILEIGPLLTDRFGIDLADVKKFKRPEEGWTAEPGKSIHPQGMVKDLPLWKSQYRFEIEAKHQGDWQVAATVEGEPVAVERNLGKGSIVITTDSFFASNEALFSGGDSDFLMWLTGGKTRLLFDETMHGSVETTGAMKLIREFRLHGFLIGVFIFVVLWAWKSASSLAPGSEAIERGLVGSGGTVSGEDSNSGLISLLKRNIPGRELIPHCLSTWKSSQIKELPPQEELEINEIARQHQIDPRTYTATETYQKIEKILRKR